MQRSPELEALSRRIVEAERLGDTAALADVLSSESESLSIGTDPRELYTGADQILAIFDVQAREVDQLRGPPAPPPIIEVRAYRIGDAGWSVVLMQGEGPIAGAAWTRATYVFQLEGAQWRVVHEHWSQAQPNEDWLGASLTTSFEDLADAAEAARPDVSDLASGDGTVTLLFSDIEGSTVLLGELGDARYKELLQWHNDVARAALARAGGREVNWQGDGFLLAFGSVRRALRCAQAIQDDIGAGYGDFPLLRLRMGVHTGEALRDRDEFFGRVIHYAARVASSAAGGEVLASKVVRELLAGDADWAFEMMPPREFKGFEGEQTVYAVTRRSDQRS